MIDLDDLLRMMVNLRGSDLHVKTGRPPIFRIDGKVTPSNLDKLTPEVVQQYAQKVLREEALRVRFKEHYAADMSYVVPDLGRFRTNVFTYRGQIGIMFRNLSQSPTVDSLELPLVVKTFAQYPKGLVLVTGPAGSGKSTTLASIINEVNLSRTVHILTLEDPIEYQFEDNKAEISQREVGLDTPSYKEGLRDAMREDPNVILVGEMRDTETISTVLTAAETGHLVFSTLHTKGAAQSISRIVDVFPPEHQQQVRIQLADTLIGVVSQSLMRRKDGGGRIAAVEVLINNVAIARSIEKNELNKVKELMEEGVGFYRMQTLNQSLTALIANGVIDRKDAEKASPSKGDLDLLLHRYEVNA
ncbi:MAG: PilT/PilU family type 4a pilus ATPase [Planctomycetota bacterium]|nr:PilT/PilU family type 4a pilus ATPase [Planctomycetota bacterium]